MKSRSELDALRQLSAQYLGAAENNLNDSDRDILTTNKLFRCVQDVITADIPREQWDEQDYENMMRAYRGMIINVLYSRQRLADAKGVIALPLTENAMQFYQENTDHSKMTFNYYLAALDACLQLASDVTAARLLSRRAGTEDIVLLRKVIEVANHALKILSVKIPRRNDVVDVAIEERRAVADAFAKLCHIYRAQGETDQALLYGAEAVIMFGKPGCDANDYVAISGVYADLAETFAHDPVSKQFFEMLSGYFFGVCETNAGEFDAVMDAFGRLPDENGQRKLVLQQARELMAAAFDYSCAVTPPNTPAKLAKNSLFKAQYDGYASSPSCSDAEESLGSPRI